MGWTEYWPPLIWKIYMHLGQFRKLNFQDKFKRDWTRARESGHPNLPEKPYQYQVHCNYKEL